MKTFRIRGKGLASRMSLLLVIVFMLSGCYYFSKQKAYYGIDTGSSKHVVFVVDISGSMEGKAETNLQGQAVGKAVNAAGNTAGDLVGGQVGNLIKRQTSNQLTKLGKAKQELMPTIRGLSEDTYFTIIIFENTVKTWKKELVQATSANKNIAIAYLEQLSSGGGTNISDALEKSFELAGEGATDAGKSLNVETVFLLSDGEPTEGAITDPAGIIEAVNKWNSAKRVVINTIGLGEDCDKEFMKNLASQNNGQFIDK